MLFWNGQRSVHRFSYEEEQSLTSLKSELNTLQMWSHLILPEQQGRRRTLKKGNSKIKTNKKGKQSMVLNPETYHQFFEQSSSLFWGSPRSGWELWAPGSVVRERDRESHRNGLGEFAKKKKKRIRRRQICGVKRAYTLCGTFEEKWIEGSFKTCTWRRKSCLYDQRWHDAET